MELGILIAAVVGHSVLAYIALANNPQSFANRAFVILNVSSACWSIATYFSIQAVSQESALFWMRLTMFFATPQAVFFLLTVATFPEGRIGFSKKLYYSLLAMLAVTVVLTVSPFLFTGVTGEVGNFQPIIGPGMLPFVVIAIGSVVTGCVVTVVKYVRSSGILKAQLLGLLVGLGLTFLLIVVFNFVLVVVFNNASFVSFGPLFTFPFLIAIAYAITKHGLFNIKVIVSEVTVAALVAVNIGQLFASSNTSEIIFRSITLFLVTLLGYLLVRSVQNEVSRREEVEELAKEKTKALAELEQRNKNLATLQKISRLVLDEIELKPMAQKILDEIPRQLENCRGALLNLVKGGQLGAYAISSTEITEKIYHLVGADIGKYSYPLKGGFNMLHEALVSKQTKESANFSEFISPPISKTLALTLQKVMGARHVVAVPLTSGVEPLGVMMFVFKVTKDELSYQDMDMIHAIADDMSIAIQRAEAYQKLKDANEYLAELDKLKDEFISMASHELNTPLAAIEGYLSMVLEEGLGKVDKRAKEYLQRAYDSSKRLAELIMDLLNVSRIEQGRLKMKFVKSNLYDLAESVVHELQIKADAKKLSLKLVADRAKVPETWCDADRIREVFVNLVGNAIKYSERGGITIKVYGDAHKVTAEVQDTGRGIAKIDQKKLFQKFSQVKREQDQQHGTGLGLYISKNFIELHKGRIWMESEEGKGSTFAFEIPVLKAAPKEVEGAVLEDDRTLNKLQSPNSKVPTGQDVPNSPLERRLG